MTKLFVAPFLCLLLFSGAQAQSQCVLSSPVALDSNGLVTLEQVANQASGTFTMRLTYSGGQSWIGIGINQQGTSNMTPATAVIGRFLNGAPSVLKYNLQSTNQDASGVIPMDTGLQNLQDATFTQTGSTSVLEFTQELNDATQQVSNDSVWIYAVGLPDNQWEGKHAIHGAFQITLDANCVDVSAQTDPPATDPPATDPPAVSPTEPTGDESDADEGDEDDEDEDAITATEPTKNEGTTNIYGNSSSGEGDSISSGNPDSSTNSQGIVSLEDPADATRPLWIAHGFLMAIAWGICAPIAIGAVLLRNVSFLAESGRWYKIHYFLNTTNALFTFAGFSLAVVATNQSGNEHFTEETHQKVGLAIFITVLFQFVVAFFRPSPPKATPQAAKSVSIHVENNIPRQGVEHAVDVDSENGSGTVEIEKDSVTHPLENKQPTKSMARLIWEISHRFIGVSLIGLAWYNCNSGIELQVENYGESDDLTAVFWGITGGICGVIFTLAYVVRV